MRQITNLTESHPITSGWLATPSTEVLRRNFGDPDLDDTSWAPVQIPHQWAHDNSFADQQSVLYRTRFSEPAIASTTSGNLRTWICIDGVMTSADVWLNGSYLGLTEGYSIPHAFDISTASQASADHVLALDVNCPGISEGPKHALTGIFQDGQAFSGHANPGGIWRNIRLERTGSVRIDRLRVVCREADAERAILGIHVRLLAAGATKVLIRTFLDPAANKQGQGRTVSHIQEAELADGENLLNWRFAVDEPDLWWPHALGEQPLYDLRVEVIVNEQISHVRKRRTGLRQVEMNNWQMHVNGERLFLKGANLLPADINLGSVPTENLLSDLRVAKDAGLDFLRIHTHISRPELYREADRIGLLLWQDLPITGEMQRSVAKRANTLALETVNLLAHHPSIAIWCAHNDPNPVPPGDQTARQPSQRKRARGRQILSQWLPTWNRTVLDRGLKRTIRKADPSRLVVASSGVLPHPPKLDGTDTHLWLGWYYGDSADIASATSRWPRAARFVTEFGAQAAPAHATEYLSAALWPHVDWEQLEAEHGVQASLLCSHVPPANYATPAEWIVGTQRYQAEVVRHLAEHLRLLKYHPTGGLAVFALRDADRGIGFGLIDKNGIAKLAMATLTQSYRPLLCVATNIPHSLVVGEELNVDLHVINDHSYELGDASIRATVELVDKTSSWQFGGAVGADSVTRIGNIRTVAETTGRLLLRLELTSEMRTVSSAYVVNIEP